MSTSHSLEALNDHALLSQFGDLLRQDHESNANLLRHIDAIDRRQLWAKLGYPSLFAFLVTRHHMSESTAGKRIGAARTAHRFPVLFSMVARGELHLSGIHRLKAHLTRENHEQVLAAAKHKTIRQIEELVARLAPQPDVPSTLRALPTRTTPTPASPAPASPAPTSALAWPAPTSASPAPTSASASLEPTCASPAPPASLALQPMPVPRRSPDPAPLSPGRYRLQVTLGENARNKLKQLQDLLAHQVPNGDLAAIVERALDALLTQVYKRKAAITDKPRSQKPRAKSKSKSTATATVRRTRYIRCTVRRDVWTRDKGRCGFVSEDGHRCNETRGLEFAHRHPWGKSGANTAINLGLRCQAHNAWEADRDYGASHMATKRDRKPLKVQEPVARYSVRRTPCATTGTVPRPNRSAYVCLLRAPQGSVGGAPFRERLEHLLDLRDADPAPRLCQRRVFRERLSNSSFVQVSDRGVGGALPLGRTSPYKQACGFEYPAGTQLAQKRRSLAAPW